MIREISPYVTSLRTVVRRTGTDVDSDHYGTLFLYSSLDEVYWELYVGTPVRVCSSSSGRLPTDLIPFGHTTRLELGSSLEVNGNLIFRYTP